MRFEKFACFVLHSARVILMHWFNLLHSAAPRLLYAQASGVHG